MASIGMFFGEISKGQVSQSNPVSGQGYCGANVRIVARDWNGIGNSYPETSHCAGFTRFTHNARGFTYNYSVAMFSDGIAIALKPNEYKTVYSQGPFGSKCYGDDIKPEFDLAMCASLTMVDIQDVTIVNTAGNDLFVGQDGNYYRYDGSIINFPTGVTVNSEPYPGVYLGSDGNYYGSNGQRIFENLPSGVTITNQYGDFFTGSDGKFYNTNGDEVFDNIPSGIYPTNIDIGEAYSFTDGKYYTEDGDLAFSNLPSGVSIVSYDDEHDNYVGSDGNKYDIDGNVTSDCNGTLLQYNDTVRITVDCVDVLGNQVNIGGDVRVGTGSISFPTATLIKQINRVVVRNLNTGASCGFGNLSAFSDVVGAKIGLDWEGVDIDGVLGSFLVFNAVFQACNQYADIIYNDSLPLGFTNLTALDYGYYCLTAELRLTWDGFSNSEFPYCCSDYDTSVSEGGKIGKTDSKIGVEDECICEELDRLNSQIEITNQRLDTISDRLSDLLCICDKLDSLNNTLVGKSFSVTVEPPVNQVTVQPPVNQVTVQPPVNQVTVQPPVNQITVTPCEPTIQNVINEGDVNVDNSDLIDKLDELFKTSDDPKETITDVIKNKEIETYNDITIESQDWAYCAKGRFEFTDVEPIVSTP